MDNSADLIVCNARVYTADRDRPAARWLAVRDGRYIAIGEEADPNNFRGPETVILDAAGQAVMPGLYDMHTHPDLALAPRYAGNLSVGTEDDPTPEEIAIAIEKHVQENPNGDWVYGQYYTRYMFRRAGVEPGRAWLDSIMPHRPVAIHDRSWGTMMVNSRALELANIDANTPDPRNGYIERDKLDERPTGILVDGAYSLIYAAMPPVAQDVLRRAYRDGIHYQSSRGVVGSKYLHVCEHRLDALKALDDAGEMTLRVEAAISWQDDIFPVRRRWQLLAGERHFYRSARLSANAVKFHFDGTHEARSSFLSGPWPGESEWRGSLNLTPEHLTDMVIDLDRRGIRVIAHCTGDGASDIFLDAVAAARRRNGPGVRHQCAHSTVLSDRNLPRFAELDVTAEFSPVGWYPYPFAYERTVFGESRTERLYNFKGVLDAGGNAVFGTDWPVSSFDPWIGFETMITRAHPQTTDDKVFHGAPITPADALRVMTINGARSMGLEATAGSITPGYSADFLLLDRDPFAEPIRGNLHKTQVDVTFLAGRPVWDRHGRFNDSPLQAVWRHPAPLV